MRKTGFNTIVILLIVAVATIAGPAAAELDIMPVSQVKEGMTGFGRTVFHGMEITEFPVRVQGVMPGAGLSGEPLILIELTGGEVEKYGGVSLGMSGSPIFLEGKLAGALSLTFPYTDHSLGGVTPIEAMLKCAEYDGAGTGQRGEVELEKPLKLGSRTYRSLRVGGGGPEGGDVLVARPALAPLAVRGLGPRAYKYIEKKFREGGVEIIPIEGPLGQGGMKRAPQEIKPGAQIQPGSSVAVQLVTGDVDMSGVGTVTAVDGDMALMFGHPFFRKGKVNYLMADARVVAIVQGEDMPFKVTDTGALRGSITQDRGSALVGRLDAFPTLIPMEVVTRDREINREKTTRVKIVRDEELMPNLVIMVILEALDNTIDKIGEGTANIRFSLKVSGREEEITRENMFYDRYDISAKTLSELVDLLLMLNENRFYDSVISGLKVVVEMDSSRSVAAIEKVKIMDRKNAGPAPALEDEEFFKEKDKGKAPAEDAGEDPAGGVESGFGLEGDEPLLIPKALDEKLAFLDKEEENLPEVFPGDRLELGIRLRPFRGEALEERLFLKVPPDIPFGKAAINVFSGTRDMPAVSPGGFTLEVKVEGPEEREQPEEDLMDESEEENSFEELLENFMDRNLNNELVATIDSLSFDVQDLEDEEIDEEMEDTRKPDGKARKKTEWVLNGTTSMKVMVKNPAGGAGDNFKTRAIKKSMINALKKE